ncbi:ATP-dependent helicase C-terminal domain-containing protein, partial [Streptomyces sp. NPDC058746]|uniref:ATP-dependent helicase C-terminal domain-containing protein n=1 Tax=Streptomyces sp. NPDC058746 TaxID=3346622 RepID=UPI0036CCB027
MTGGVHLVPAQAARCQLNDHRASLPRPPGAGSSRFPRIRNVTGRPVFAPLNRVARRSSRTSRTRSLASSSEPTPRADTVCAAANWAGPATVHLLSPAGHPAAVTGGLASFWREGHRAVRAGSAGATPATRGRRT